MKAILAIGMLFVLLLAAVSAGKRLGLLLYAEPTRKRLRQVGYRWVCIFPLWAAISYFSQYWFTGKEPNLAAWSISPIVFVALFGSAWLSAWRRVCKAER